METPNRLRASHKRIGFVTENPHKVAEWQAICSRLMPELVVEPITPLTPVMETEASFEGNALLKAKAGLPCHGVDAVVGEDAGVIIPALSGTDGLALFPGLYSNRWFTPAWANRLGVDGTDNNARNQATLVLMNGQTDRRAYYTCVLAALPLTNPPAVGQPVVCKGEWHLNVAHQLDGVGGFGYDPIMQVADGCTVAQLSAEEKNRASHRAMAIQQLLTLLYSDINR
jgi:XTP/dITP diphosphohydrolase